jgi:hypothetical protein
MPFYDFINENTGEEWEACMSYSDMKKLTTENSDIKIVYRSMNIVGGQGDRIKTDNGFKDMLGRIADANPHSPLAQKHGNKGIQASKIRAAVNKAKNKK